MPHFVCVTCGCQYAETEAEPERCKICDEERQYVSFQGQAWTTLEELRRDHENRVEPMEPGLTRYGTRPGFAIGQHMYLIESAGGNVLWDSITLVDEPTLDAIRARGGVTAMAISHPHYYSAIVEWSRALGDIPVYVHAADREWLTRPDPAIVFWDEESRSIGDGVTLIRTGGHFAGSTVLHWAAGAGGKGALMAGDSIQVAYDLDWVSFMYSYPNMIPLSPAKIRRVVDAVEPYDFDRIYSPWLHRVVDVDGKAVVRRSAERYLAAITDAS